MRRSSSKGIIETDCYCKIRLLDDSEISCEFKKDCKGQDVFDRCCKELDLLEKDYFGLRYVDTDKQRHWLDLNKNLIKQMKSKPPYTLFFRVKFYPQDPGKIVEEITRYHLFVQVKRDILHGRLLCSFNDLADLGGYIVQGNLIPGFFGVDLLQGENFPGRDAPDELGDYDPEDHKEGYLSEFRVVPKQNEKLEAKIAENHKNLSGLTPSDCEKEFLDKVKLLEMYGVDPHPCKDQEGVQLYLGLTPEGIAIIREAKKVSGFPWADVLKVSYDSRVFYVQIQKEERKANYGFRLPDHGACKHLWKCAIEHHTFYSNEIKPGKVRRSSMSPQRFFKRHSKYQYSGRTQDQVIKESLSIQRATPDIKRTPSIRISSRQDAVSKKSSETANNNRNSADTPTGDGSTSTSSGSDPLKEFETEHIPDVPPDEHNHSHTDIDLIDASKRTVTENGPVAEVGAMSDSAEPGNEGNMALSVLFIMLLVALIIIPVAVVVQSNKEGIKSSSAYKSFATWFESVTGVSIL